MFAFCLLSYTSGECFVSSIIYTTHRIAFSTGWLCMCYNLDMNERLRYYQKRCGDVLLYLRHMPDLALRTALFACFVCIGIAGYLIGDMRVRMEGVESEVAVTGALTFVPYATATLEIHQEELKDGAFVAGKTGGVYYAKSCKGWSRIAAKNRIWFSTAHNAEDAGYARAKNCR